ncbi:MAG: 2Fe-2S iron-sulfur cluster binding domain-containing protein, partial [Treponema sp.]|nr:2Fe-2S iron-sulfur cluster binding domain-containing protein [Treponema sp.]
MRIQVEPGTRIIDAARRAGVPVETPCNGLGLCGKCGVEVAGPGSRVLACRTVVENSASYIVRNYDEENNSLRILSEGNNFAYERKPFISKKHINGKTEVYGGGLLLGVEEGDTTASLYGLAVDIGTTTIVASLVDLQTGTSLASESALNPQSRYAQDVLGRIHFAGKNGGMDILYRAFIETLSSMIESLAGKAGIERRNIYEAVYSGNTTMLHLA